MLKRFMTWLLHQFQKAMGLFNRKNPNARSAAPTHTANTDHSSQPVTDIDDPVALRTSLPPSTVSLRQESSPTPKDAVNPSDPVVPEPVVPEPVVPEPVVPEPDTHQRLDAASAARPGGVVAAPSFPTEVSELLSSQSSLQPPSPQSDIDELRETALPVSDQSASEQQLPDIHDLLPAVEPDVEEEDAAPVEDAFDEPVAALPTATVPAEAPFAVSEDAVEIETAERVSSTEPVVLFSFDISEADTQPKDTLDDSVASGPEVQSESSLDASESLETEPPETELGGVDDDISKTALDAKPATESLPIADELEAAAVVEENLISTESSSEATQLSDEPVPLSNPVELEETAENSESAAFVTEGLGSEEILEDAASADATPETPAVINPWLMAKPPASTTKVSTTEDLEKQSEEPAPEALKPGEPEEAKQKTVDTEVLPTKVGVVKLLFVLKPGNFHGYIAPDDGTKDILFHQKYINAEIFDCLERGSKVVATIKHIEGKVYATRVDLAS